MGLFSGSSTTKKTETFDTGPSSFQSPYLKQAFDSAQNIYNKQAGTPYYQGQTYAGMSQEAKDTLAKLRSYASTTGMSTADQLNSLGSQMAAYGAKAGSTIDQYLAMAGQDPTQSNIDAANKYAANPYVDAMIDANSRDVTRNLTEDTLPSIDRSASGTGNINSSRAGVAAGIARRGAEDRIADISASIRGNAYNQGLSMAQQDRAQNLSALGSAASAYGSLANSGISALGKAADTAYGAFDAINKANSTEQADRQGGLTADFQKWLGEDTRASDVLSRYMNTVGSNPWGSSGTSSGTTKTTEAQSILSSLMGAGLAGAGIVSGIKNAGKAASSLYSGL